MAAKQHRAETRHIVAMLAQATPQDITDGQTWYRRAETFAARHTASGLISFCQAAGVLAALSPNNRWNRNCSDATALIQAHLRGDDLETVKVCTFGPNKAKAVQILSLSNPTQETISRILLGKQGRKVEAFFLSITGRHDAVCVDGHAYAIWKGQRIPTTKTPSIGAKLYETIARAYCIVSARSAQICGHQLTPAQVQAVTWVTYRRLLGVVD